MRLKSVVFFVLTMSFVLSVQDAHAQHHGGQQAPPISFGDGQVTVDTSIVPSNFVPGKDTSTNLKVRFFDVSTGFNIPSVTYRVQVFHNEQLLANQMYYDNDGELDIKIQPNSKCDQIDLWRCTLYEGEKDPIVPNAFASTDKSRPVIRGPVFDKSGTYAVKVAIIGATNPKTQTKDINFETNIMIANEQETSITTTLNEVPVTIRDFQEQTPSIQFDESSKSIKMSIPFSWEHVQHIPMIRDEIVLPKTFREMDSANSFSGFVNGVQILPKDLHYDKISEQASNVIHVMINGDELQSIKQKISDSDSFSLVIVPNYDEFVKTSKIPFDNNYFAMASVDSRYSENKDTVFSISFFDATGNLVKDVRYAYSVKDPLGHETLNMGGNQNKIGLKLSSGTDYQIIPTSIEGKYVIQLVLIGIGFDDFKNYVYKEFSFEMKKPIQANSPSMSVDTLSSKVPNWIKNNAKWWAEGQVDDKSFVQGIQYLIKQKVITISQTQTSASSNDIPSWVKNNAKWWADDQISENDFLKGIEYLVSIGIIRIE